MNVEKKPLITAFLINGSLILLFGCKIYWDLPSETQHTVIWSFLVGVILFIAGLLLRRNAKFYNWVRNKLQNVGDWLDVSSLQAFLFITSPLYAILAINAAGFWIKMRSPYVAVTAWLLGITLAFWGSWKFTEAKPSVSKITLVWFAVVTALAFLVRGLATGEIPILLTGDEASAGISAIDYAKGAWNNIFITSWHSFPSLFPFIQSLSVGILGNTVAALRIPSALIGAVTVGVVYLCGKTMFGERTGIFAALILAASHFHIHFSRLGLNNIWDGLWFTITIGALWYGWKTQFRWAYLIAGLGLGFSQYFYASSKALIGILFIAAVFTFLYQRSQFRQASPDFAATVMVALVIFIPLIWYYSAEPNALFAPFARVSILNQSNPSGASTWNFLFKQLPTSLGAYTHIQSVDWYSPGTPLLRPLAAVFFFIGLAALCLEDRDSRLLFLTLWLVAFAFINALSSYYGPAAQRYVASAPACSLIAGYGLHKISEKLSSLWRRGKNIIIGASYLLLMVMMISDLSFYFLEYTASTYFDELTSNGMAAYQFANYLKDQPDGTQVVFMHNPRMSSNSASILYLAPQVKGVDAPEQWETFDKTQLQGNRIIFAFLEENRNEIDVVQNDFPGGKPGYIETWSKAILVWLYEYELH